MSKKDKTVVPKLRLSQFNGNSEWSVRKLEDVSEPVEERAGVKKYTLMSVTSGVGLVSQIEKFGREIAGSAYKNYYVIKKNDFAYNKSATKKFPQGYISMLTKYEDAALPNSIFTCFRIIDDECEPRFFDHLFHNNYHGTWLRKYIEVGARAHGSLSVETKHLWNMPIALPKLLEQQKIADCLSSLDDLINAEDKKLTALRAHKKGLMQKLFPAEGKTVPEWRFSEFKDCGEWEKKFVEEYFVVGSSKRVLQESWTTQGIPFYRTRELVSLSKNEPFKSEIFISDELFCELSKKYGIPSEGDFLISGVGTLGISYQVQSQDKFYFKDGNVLWFRLKPGLCSTYFKYCFESDYIQNQIIKQSSASTVGTYTIQKAKRTKFWYSHSEDEQQKIADILSSVDKLITAQAEKIEALKQHKKGLMQGLFPSVEEVTQ